MRIYVEWRSRCVRAVASLRWAPSLRSPELEDVSVATDSSFDHGVYDRLARTCVDKRDFVDYAGVKAEISALRDFVEQLAATSPKDALDLFPTADDRKRYFLTASDALVLYHAAEAYPEQKCALGPAPFFKDKDIVLGSRELTLNELEHGIIGKQFVDARIHVFLNFGADGRALAEADRSSLRIDYLSYEKSLNEQ
jgi:hypothetical protein